MKKLIILGASGSIGNQTLDVLSQDPTSFKLLGFSLGHRIEQIPTILEKNKEVRFICVQEKESAIALKEKYPQITFFFGDEGLLELIDATKPDLIVNALVGFCGFVPTYHAFKNGISVALANKETLVVGGELLKQLQKKTGAKLYPIDSEHVALAKCLKGNRKDVEHLILTASGGAFRNLKREDLQNVTVKQALCHPSWKMGEKITIDCATMMNKGFEMIEAHYLFDIPMHRIEVLLHDESKVHSLILLRDGSYLADIGPSDMRNPISYALYGGQRKKVKIPPLSLSDFGTFHFHPYDPTRYPCVEYAKRAMLEGGTMPTVLNAANEVAVRAFLHHEIAFLSIEKVIEDCMNRHRVISSPTVEDIVYVDSITRKEAEKRIKEVYKL